MNIFLAAGAFFFLKVVLWVVGSIVVLTILLAILFCVLIWRESKRPGSF